MRRLAGLALLTVVSFMACTDDAPTAALDPGVTVPRTDGGLAADGGEDAALDAGTGDAGTAFTVTTSADGFRVTAGDVPAPDFAISLADLTIRNDAGNLVTTASGFVQLTLASHPAQSYAVLHDALPTSTTPDALATLLGAAPHGGTLISPYRIPAVELDLAGVDLTDGITRTVLLRNTGAGVSSYQVLTLRFSARPAWVTGEWGTCSTTCGGGEQARTVVCELDGAPAAPATCLDAAPASTRACNTNECGSWVSSTWSVCSAACGGGTQTRTNQCQVAGSAVDPGLCPGTPPALVRACNEEACGIELGAFATRGTCGVLGVLGPGFTLTAGNAPLPVGTTITIVGAGIPSIGVFSVSGGTATVSVLSNVARMITLTGSVPAGATIAMRTTIPITVAFTLNAQVALPNGYQGTGAKLSGTVTSTGNLCSVN